MNIVLAQFFTPNLSYGEFSKAINEKYCQEKGYTYHLESDEQKIRNGLEGRAPTWYKPKLLLEVLETKNPDYVLFLDADAIVLNNNHRIEDFIVDGIDILAADDHGPSKLNAGVFIVKNTSWTKEYLQKWWDICKEYPKYENGLWHDQTCFGILMDRTPDLNNHVKIINNNVINSNHENDHCFIFHAFAFGSYKNRTIDLIYYNKFGLSPPTYSGMPLNKLADLYAVDKGSQGHNYINRVYENLLAHNKYNIKKFVEIGVYQGNSLRMWRSFFDGDTKIVGVDADIPTVKRGVDGCELILCDQTNNLDLKALSEKIKGADVILDDGCHKMEAQQKSLAILFKSLAPGGTYIIEDLHTSIECKNPDKVVFGWGDPNKITTLDLLENYLQTNKIKSEYLDADQIKYLEKNIERVEVFKLSNESITSIITKKLVPTEATVLDKPKENIGIVYHVYCVGFWEELVKEQLLRLKNTGLYDAASILWVTINDLNNNKTRIDKIFAKYPKFQIEYRNDNSAEAPGIRKVYDICQGDTNLKVLYFHAKGVSNTYRSIENKQELCQRKIEGSKSWRLCMEHFLIAGWEDCVKRLDYHDVVCTTYTDSWVWGNFWWANADYIRAHPFPADGTRWFFEYWITMGDITPQPNVFEYYHFSYLALISKIPSYIFNGSLPPDQKIELISATYGALDVQMDEGYPTPPEDISDKIVNVTEYAQKNLELNNFVGFDNRISSSWPAGLDPFVGGRKHLTIDFKVSGQEEPVSLTFRGADSEFYLYQKNKPYPEKLRTNRDNLKSNKNMNNSSKKKIAVVSPMAFERNGQAIPEMYKKCILPFFLTAKKNFLPNKEKYDVEFLLLTNSNYTCELDFVKTIRTYEQTTGYSYGCLMKILLLEHVPNEYDYIFVADMDSIFPSEMNEDILGAPFVFLDHYYKPSLNSVLEVDTDHVSIDADVSNEHWTMDTFFGGTYEIMMNFNKFARAQHNKYFGKVSKEYGFYSKYPGELFILKYVFENNIKHKRLSACCELDSNSVTRKWHIGELPNNLDSKNGLGIQFLNNYCQLHQTKMSLDILDEVVKYVLGEPSKLLQYKAKKDGVEYNPPQNEVQDKSNPVSKINEKICDTDTNPKSPFSKLKELAIGCDTIVELGTGEGRTTMALLSGKPRRMYSYDLNESVNSQSISAAAADAGTNYTFTKGSTLEISIPECDLLFVDTVHLYSQVKYELEYHGSKAKKYIIFSGTETFGHLEQEDGVDYSKVKAVSLKSPHGIVPAINEFLDKNPEWFIAYQTPDNSGLVVIQKIDTKLRLA
jgi:hypothetical protein